LKTLTSNKINNWLSEPKRVLFLFGFVFVITYLPMLFAGFVNDDFQILLWHNPENILDCFKTFYTLDISQFYFRPLPNFLHSLTIYLLGFNAFWLRLENLLILILSTYYLYKILKELKVDTEASILSALLCFLLPAKQILAGWIAARGDGLVLLFLLLSSLYYLRFLNTAQSRVIIFAGFFYFLALLSKEHAFAAVFLPFAFILFDSRKNKLSRAFKSFAVGISLLVLVLIYRFVLVTGTPFSSSHFEGTSYFEYLSNYFIYILLSFFPPEYFQYIRNIWLIDGMMLFQAIFTGIFLLIAGLYIAKVIFSPKSRFFNNATIFGFAWYSIMILPVLPQLMRWYPYVSSIGIGFILAGLISNSQLKNAHILRKIVIGIIILFAFLNFYESTNWKIASDKVTQIGTSLENYSYNQEESHYFWAIPDKINNTATMKLGVKQAIQHFIGSHIDDIETPLRLETYGKHHIKYEILDDYTLVFKGENISFIPRNWRSQSVAKTQELTYNYDNYTLTITTLSSKNKLTSTAIIKFNSPMNKHNHYFYDGNIIQKIDLN
jgi:hypothetical protein